MSFILDALKNLEEKRNNESAPDLTTIHSEGSDKQGKRPLLTYISIAVLILNAIVLAAWLRPQNEENSSCTLQAAKEETDKIITKNNMPPAEATEPVNAPDVTVTENQRVPATETDLLPINASPEEIRALKRTIAEEQLLVNVQPAFNMPVEDNSADAPEGTVPDMSQLPLSVKEGLPDLTIKAHIYSNDTMSRLVNINGNIVREGGSVATGLTVSEITISGVIFDYSGQLFSIRAF